MTKVTLPRLNQTGTNEWSDVESNDVALREVVNGQLTNENLEAAAGIVDTKLASPNNSVYRAIHSAFGLSAAGMVAGTYILGTNEGAAFSTGIAPSGASLVKEHSVGASFFYFDDADYTVAGKTQKLRLRSQLACNGTKATLKFTFGLYPITVSGGITELKITLGTVVSGSTVEINEPAASTVSSGVSSEFTIPADGAYALGCVTGASMTTGSAVLLSAQLQTRNV